MSTTEQLRRAVAPAKPTQTAVADDNKPKTIVEILKSADFKAQMALALPKTLTADRLIRIVLTECRKTPELRRCNQASFFGAVLQCAQLGLEPGSALGHCYLLPYGNGKAKDGLPNCQLIIGYRGMIDLARRSGQIVSINAYCVHEKDEFIYELGLHPDIKHRPSAMANRGPVTFVYAVAQLQGGGVQFEVMSRAEIEAVRSQSKAGTRGPWVTHWEEMARKTVVRRLFKYLPVSTEALRAVEVDEKSDRGEAVTETDFLDAAFVDKGQELHHVTPEEEVTDLEPQAPAEAPTIAPDDQPDAGAPAVDPWVAGYEAAQQTAG
jgi:recombination protein RecT